MKKQTEIILKKYVECNECPEPFFEREIDAIIDQINNLWREKIKHFFWESFREENEKTNKYWTVEDWLNDLVRKKTIQRWDKISYKKYQIEICDMDIKSFKE